MQLPATRQKIESNDSHVTRTLDDALVNVDVNASLCVCVYVCVIAADATAARAATAADVLLPVPATISN